MIEVFYSTKQVVEGRVFELKVQGHAEYAEKGKDIVCAGVSALTGAIVDKLQALEEEGKAKNEIEIKDAEVSVKTLSQLYVDTLEVGAVFDTVLYGLRNIYSQFPKNLRVY